MYSNSMIRPEQIKGRGTATSPHNRFEKIMTVEGGDFTSESYDDEEKKYLTQFIKDPSRTIVTQNNSPDVGFDFSVNPYRGCEHGCVYCFARPTHEYLGMNSGLDFETKILVKYNAPELLRDKLSSKSWRPEVINFSGITDCYQPIERKLELTRRCLQVMQDFRNPFTIITKNHLVTRDIDIFKPMSEINGVCVFISITSLDPKLAAVMEPRTSHPVSRLRAVEELAKNGIPVGVMTAPLIPGLNDHEVPDLLRAVSDAGAYAAHYVPLRLPYALDDIFIQWLEQHFPIKKEKVLSRIREIRGGELNNSEFGNRMRGEGVYAENLRSMFKLFANKYGLNKKHAELTTEHFRHEPIPGQMSFF